MRAVLEAAAAEHRLAEAVARRSRARHRLRHREGQLRGDRRGGRRRPPTASPSIASSSSFECGAIVNPDGLHNQVEGAVVQGLGGALFEAIDSPTARSSTARWRSIACRGSRTCRRSRSCCSIGATCRRPAPARRRSSASRPASAARSAVSAPSRTRCRSNPNVDVATSFSSARGAGARQASPLRSVYVQDIKTLANFDQPATDDEVAASALQFVREAQRDEQPSKANEAVFNRAVDEVHRIG